MGFGKTEVAARGIFKDARNFGRNVDPKAVQRQYVLKLVPGRKMDRAGADHTRNRVFPDSDGFPGERTRVDPADGREAEDPVRLFIVQHESDFVHMRGDHDARRAGLFRFFHGDQVP